MADNYKNSREKSNDKHQPSGRASESAQNTGSKQCQDQQPETANDDSRDNPNDDFFHVLLIAHSFTVYNQATELLV